MPTVRFKPLQVCFEVETNTKLLVVANRNKLPIRYGCASCRCGTCGIKIETDQSSNLSPMRSNERELLARMHLPVDGTVRLACQTRIVSGLVTIDLDFQNTYSPDDGDSN